MIDDKKTLKEYLEADKKALEITRDKPRFYSDEVWRFQRALRIYEYTLNTENKHIFGKLQRFYRKFIFHSISVKLGFSIPPNTCGKGLAISHYGSIIINSKAKIGENCRLHVGCVIGSRNGEGSAPVIGDNVFLGMGCKILGDISIADGVAVGANAVVTKSIEEPNTTWAGVPAKKISSNGAEKARGNKAYSCE